MANKKISELTENTSPLGSDYLVEVDGDGNNRKISIANLAKAINGGITIVICTQTEYDAIDPVDPNTIYVITGT